MSKAERSVLLVGGVPGKRAEDVFRTVAPILGDLAIGLTDGETGLRRMWIFFVAENLWRTHPEIEVVREASGVEGFPEEVLDPKYHHIVPTGYDDFPWFKPREGIDRLTTEGVTSTYPDEARESYAVFRALRDEGVIPQGARFQQCIPFPDDAVRLFTGDADSMAALVDAYVEVIKQDVVRICADISHRDLLLQWDINWETVAIEHGDHLPGAYPMQFKPHGDPWDRYVRYIKELNAVIPETVPVGLHLCYGDLHHKHFKDPEDLRASVDMANRAVKHSPHRIDFVHMSVPRHRSDDAYFDPLKDLNMGNATLYAGLVHYTDGVEGTLGRLATLKRHYDGPTGVATECGLGRRPLDQDLIKLLEIHRTVSQAI